MNWLKRILGFKEPDSTPVSESKPVIVGTVVEKPKKIFANACEENDAFISEHWNLYPDYIQEHISNYREITRISNLYDSYEWELRGYFSGMERYLDIAKNAKYADIKLPGTEKIIAEYDAKIQAMRDRINALPGTRHLRDANTAFETRANEDGWMCWYGTGGLHWNKKGVVHDGSGVFYVVREK
ncbi:MAG: hypothetical protein PHN69_03550 [Candidatus Pacebacteria bacterium]|nr:hypothetical protein [Fermentimonas sp.]MDD4804225.1 hypothetical protein [Candidatus Paceibacterota bacterium]